MKKRKQTARVKAMAVANANHRAYYPSVQIEQWLRDNNGNKIIFDHKIENDLVVVHFRAFPPGNLGFDTTDQIDEYKGYCMRFNIEPKQAIDNLNKYLRQESIVERIRP